MTKKILPLLFTSLLLLSCSKEDDITTTETNPSKPSEIVTIKYFGESIQVEKINGQYVLEGDIILIPDNDVKITESKNNTTNKINSTGRIVGRWPNNIVYYTIDPALSNQQRVINAISHWESNTSLRFIPRTNQTDYIYFTNGTINSSYTGHIGGKQDLTLSTGGSTGNTIHEIGHAIGLWHEQSRKDRDDYVTIIWDNILPNTADLDYSHQFQKYKFGDGDEYTSSLDFGSIMMYGSDYFSKGNGFPTITKKDGSIINVQRNGLSIGDIEGVNKMYPRSIEITNAGSGCDDKKCIWITGVLFENNETYVEIRHPEGDWRILNTYSPNELTLSHNQNNDGISFRLKTQEEIDLFSTKGLRIFVVNRKLGTFTNYGNNNITYRSTLQPQITNAGSGCDDKNCIWITGDSFEGNFCRVELRDPYTYNIVGTYYPYEIQNTNNNLISLRLKTQNEINIFTNSGLRVFVVNELNGKWSNYGNSIITYK